MYLNALYDIAIMTVINTRKWIVYGIHWAEAFWWRYLLLKYPNGATSTYHVPTAVALTKEWRMSLGTLERNWLPTASNIECIVYTWWTLSVIWNANPRRTSTAIWLEIFVFRYVMQYRLACNRIQRYCPRFVEYSRIRNWAYKLDSNRCTMDLIISD